MASVSAETLVEMMNKAIEERSTPEKLIKLWLDESLPEVMKGVFNAAKNGKNEYSHYIPSYINLSILENYFKNCKLSQLWLPSNRETTTDEVRVTIRWANPPKA
jgi:hypothetical protein